MNTRDLIMSTNALGHLGVRREFCPGHEAGEDDLVIIKAINADLIHLLAAWRSTEENSDQMLRHSGPVDRHVYGLTNKGWAYKVSGGTDHLQNWLVDVMADAETAHWGTVDDAGSYIRYPESAFDEWEYHPPLLTGNYDRNYDITTCKPVRDEEPPATYTAKGEDVARQSAAAPAEITVPPGYARTHDEIYPILEARGEKPVDLRVWLAVGAAGAVVFALAGLGWMLS